MKLYWVVGIIMGTTILFSILLSYPSTIIVFAQQNDRLENDDLFISVQTILRDSDGNLIAYLESTKFTDLNRPALERFLDYEASRGDDPVTRINGENYQVIRRAQDYTFDSESVIGSTNIYDTIDDQTILLARFAHDGYPVEKGDTLESIWTFVRKI